MLIEINVLLIVVAVAIASAAVLEFLIRIRQATLVGWIKRNQKAAWHGLPRLPRLFASWFDYSSAIGALEREGGIEDPEFHSRIRALQRLEVFQAAAVLVIVAGGALAFLGWPPWSISFGV